MHNNTKIAVLVVKYFTYLKHTALDRLQVRLNVILFIIKLHTWSNYGAVGTSQRSEWTLGVALRRSERRGKATESRETVAFLGGGDTRMKLIYFFAAELKDGEVGSGDETAKKVITFHTLKRSSVF